MEKNYMCTSCYNIFTEINVQVDKNLTERCPHCNTALGGDYWWVISRDIKYVKLFN